MTDPSADRLRLMLRAELAQRKAQAIDPHEDYQHDPICWIVDKLGIPEQTLRWSMNPGYEDHHEWDGNEDPLVLIAESLASWKSVGVESGTGTQKSYTAAALTLWFLACFENSRVNTYAPKEDQLRQFMWAEISDLWPRFKRLFPTAELTDLRIRMNGTDKWSAHGYSVRVRAGEKSATAAQGAHAEHMLLITEETPGIDPSVMTALFNTMTAPQNVQLALGNPDSQHDELHRFCKRSRVVDVRISSLDHPNVVCDDASIVPGAVSAESVEDKREEYASTPRFYESRVRGISPSEASDALIHWAWCEAAAQRFSNDVFRQGEPAIGVDVADVATGDKAAIAKGIGACLTEIRSFPSPGATQLGVDIATLIDVSDVSPRMVGVDSVGVGAGTVGRLKEMGYHVQALNGGSSPRSYQKHEARARTGRPVLGEERFQNLRSQMHWLMREDLEGGHIALPNDSELFEDLTAPTWTTRNGVIRVESKEDLKKRLGRSPDKGDAAIYWNFVRSRPEFEDEEDRGISSANYDHLFQVRMKEIERAQRGSVRAF